MHRGRVAPEATEDVDDVVGVRAEYRPRSTTSSTSAAELGHHELGGLHGAARRGRQHELGDRRASGTRRAGQVRADLGRLAPAARRERAAVVVRSL